MKSKQRQNRSRRGVIGIESAIVLIAFVMVAAALSFVILNMGFSTTQKAKTTIQSGLAEASSAMEITGGVIGNGNATQNRLHYYAIPIKVAPGGESVNLETANTAIRYYSNKIALESIYKGILPTGTYSNSTAAIAAAKTANMINQYPWVGSGMNQTTALVYFTTNKNNNQILDNGENAIVLVMFKNADKPTSLEEVRTEVIVPTGSLLTVKRHIPSISDTIVDLG
ncbi:archaellin/type IV pilin N-terminal domain-containing protein [Nitrososphaera sp.]|uniref:archaellin/type IV pilin N-terminal domain-containing protein n=1 Tax=Nitrososphaera sp. TaxID=1971748 RepID=UPI00307E45EA